MTTQIEAPIPGFTPKSDAPNPDGLQPVLDTIRQNIIDAGTALRVENEPATPQSDYYQLYREQKAENEHLKAVIAASKIQPTASHPDQNIKAKTYQQTRAQLGDVRWHRMSDNERLLAMGQDPSQERGFIKQLWGKGADPRLAQDLFKTNPKKYRETREAAYALGIFGQ